MIRRSFGHSCEIHLPISLRFSGCPGHGSKGVGCVLTFGSGFQGRHCYLVAPMEYTVVADYFAGVNL
jgi:hypothetical protein